LVACLNGLLPSFHVVSSDALLVYSVRHNNVHDPVAAGKPWNKPPGIIAAAPFLFSVVSSKYFYPLFLNFRLLMGVTTVVVCCTEIYMNFICLRIFKISCH
jgi:hypothetical protein